MEIYHIHNLFSATKTRVATARQLCRQGQKDNARDVVRFVRNASILQILKAADFSNSPFGEINWALLEWELSQLELECHPAAAAENVNHDVMVLEKLDIIAGGISKLLSK